MMATFPTTWREVTQTRTGFPSGNCTEACIASVLGCDLDEVPQLWSGRDDCRDDAEAQPRKNLLRLARWLHERGWAWREWTFAGRPELPLPRSAFTGAERWAGPIDQVHLIAGINPDGLAHMVVGKGGEVVWDPNPQRRGIQVATAIGQIVPLGLLSARDRFNITLSIERLRFEPPTIEDLILRDLTDGDRLRMEAAQAKRASRLERNRGSSGADA